MVGLLIILGTVILVMSYILKKIIINSKVISKFMNPIGLGFLYIVIITTWIYIDNPDNPDDSNVIRTKLQLYQTLIASIGAVCIAIIAYFGAVYNAKMQKKKDIQEKVKNDEIIYPSKLVYNLLLLNEYIQYNIEEISKYEESENNKLKTPGNFNRIAFVLDELVKLMGFEEITKYDLFTDFQSYKIFLYPAVTKNSIVINQKINLDDLLDEILDYEMVGPHEKEDVWDDEYDEYNANKRYKSNLEIFKKERCLFIKNTKSLMNALKLTNTEIKNAMSKDPVFGKKLVEMETSIKKYSEIKSKFR